MSSMRVIGHTEVGAGNAVNITFSNIPQTFTDLLLVTSLRSNRDAKLDRARVVLNGDQANNYTYRTFVGTGTSIFGEGITTNGMIFYSANGNTASASTFSTVKVLLPNYRVSGIVKVASLDGSWASFETNESWREMNTGTWNGTTAITSLSLVMDFGTAWLQYSSSTLYGITAGSSGGVTVS